MRLRLASSVRVTYEAVELRGWHGNLEQLELWTIALRERFAIWRYHVCVTLSVSNRKLASLLETPIEYFGPGGSNFEVPM